MSAAAQSGFVDAMAAATYLSRKGIPFRSAHEIVGKAVSYCLTQGCELGDLSLEQLREFSPAFDQEFYAAVTLEAVLGCHDVTGGTAPARVHSALQQIQQRIAALQEELHAHA
jgi:argininosuccinate lyase